MSILSEALSGTLLGMTRAGCTPLPHNTTAAENALWTCASNTVGFTEAVMLLTVGALFGAAVVVAIVNYLLATRRL